MYENIINILLKANNIFRDITLNLHRNKRNFNWLQLTYTPFADLPKIQTKNSGKLTAYSCKNNIKRNGSNKLFQF